jgi:hypothetical protein
MLWYGVGSIVLPTGSSAMPTTYEKIPPEELRLLVMRGSTDMGAFTVLQRGHICLPHWAVWVWIVGESHVATFYHKATRQMRTEVFICVPVPEGSVRKRRIILPEQRFGDMHPVQRGNVAHATVCVVKGALKYDFSQYHSYTKTGASTASRACATMLRAFRVATGDTRQHLLLSAGFPIPNEAVVEYPFSTNTSVLVYEGRSGEVVLESLHGFPDADEPTLVSTETRVRYTP